MTSFSQTNINRSPAEWVELALEETKSNNSQHIVFAGIVMASIVSIPFTPLAGAGICIATFIIVRKRIQASKRSQDLIIQYGCVAHQLSDRDFCKYRKQAEAEGKLDIIYQELNFAKLDGFEIKGLALEFLESYKPSADSKQNLLPPSITQPAIVQQATIVPTEVKTSEMRYEDKASIDLMEKISESLINKIFISTPGGGKGIIVSNLIRKLKSKYLDLKIFVIDPKNDPDESGYWDGVADKIARLSCERLEPDAVAEWLSECIEKYYEFHKVHKQVLLIWDEGTITGSKVLKSKTPDLIKDTIRSLSSAGDSAGRNIWVMAQSPFLKNLGLDTEAASQLTASILIRKPGIVSQWSRSPLVPKTEQALLKKLIKESDCNRAIYYAGTGEWYPMPKLQNFSNKDRDAMKKPQSEALIEKIEATNLNLNEFIATELGVTDPEKKEEVKLKIITTLKASNRDDLLGKFGDTM